VHGIDVAFWVQKVESIQVDKPQVATPTGAFVRNDASAGVLISASDFGIVVKVTQQ